VVVRSDRAVDQGAMFQIPRVFTVLADSEVDGVQPCRGLHWTTALPPSTGSPGHRVTGESFRRYEHDQPGDLLHVDVKKLGNIPAGGGWRYLGRQRGRRNRSATPDKPRNQHHNPKMGTAFVHTVIDDHSRLAYAEIHDDETAATAIAVLRNAVAWYSARGITTHRVLSDNGSAYRSFLWRAACAELGITAKRTRPYRPQTNGKIERFHRTLAAGWAFRRLYTSESARRNALPAWLHEYNHHRPHTAIGKVPPITRLTNLPGHYI
jgi:transposase InsO family protein